VTEAEVKQLRRFVGLAGRCLCALAGRKALRLAEAEAVLQAWERAKKQGRRRNPVSRKKGV
jgi:hypothetical protein